MTSPEALRQHDLGHRRRVWHRARVRRGSQRSNKSSRAADSTISPQCIAANPGTAAVELDITDSLSIERVAATLIPAIVLNQVQALAASR
jgi:hypothetical protein